jgi:hypothetical protein
VRTETQYHFSISFFRKPPCFQLLMKNCNLEKEE